MSESALGKASSDSSCTDKGFSCDICGEVLAHESHVARHKRLKHPSKLDHSCPTCEDVFSSERGVKLHHKRTHGVSLSWEESECDNCGETFEYRHRDTARFCSIECRDAFQVAENAANWKGGKVECVCDWCGDTFKTDPHKADSVRFCDMDCQMSWHSRAMGGEGNPQWNGGKLHYYGPNWNRQRSKARERDNHTCQDCGTHASELDKAISVHHIQPRRRFVNEAGKLDYESANQLDNLICLCPACHRKWEGLYLRPDTR